MLLMAGVWEWTTECLQLCHLVTTIEEWLASELGHLSHVMGPVVSRMGSCWGEGFGHHRGSRWVECFGQQKGSWWVDCFGHHKGSRWDEGFGLGYLSKWDQWKAEVEPLEPWLWASQGELLGRGLWASTLCLYHGWASNKKLVLKDNYGIQTKELVTGTHKSLHATAWDISLSPGYW